MSSPILEDQFIKEGAAVGWAQSVFRCRRPQALEYVREAWQSGTVRLSTVLEGCQNRNNQLTQTVPHAELPSSLAMHGGDLLRFFASRIEAVGCPKIKSGRKRLF